MDPYSTAANMHASTSYSGQHFGPLSNISNPPSTHSSPHSFSQDLPPSTAYQHHISHSQTYPIPGGTPWPSEMQHQSQQRRSLTFNPRRASYNMDYLPQPPTTPLLQLDTTHGTEHDPNERTARPGNAFNHTQFHLSLPLPTVPDSGNSLVTPTATSGSSSMSSMSSAGLSSAGNVSSATSIGSNFIDAQQEHIQKTQEQRQAALDSGSEYIAGTPGLSQGLSRPLTQHEKERLAYLDRLKYFLATAPSRWNNADGENGNGGGTSASFSYPGMSVDGSFSNQTGQNAPGHPQLNRFMLPTQEFVTCVLWKGLYHITGTDIVRALVFRFEAFGRPVRNMKKFEEGVFSDLRNLRPGVDACLEEPKSGFLDLLFKYQCIRTQKKQKVFYWFSVPHDRLFLDALDRDLKREKMGQEPTTVVAGEPALSFTYDPKRPLYEQFSKMLGARDGESEYDRNLRHAVNNRRNSSVTDGEDSSMDGHYTADESDSQSDLEGDSRRRKQLFGYPLFPGSSTYKERRRNAANAKRAHRQDSEGPGDEHRGRSEGPGQSGSRHGSASASRERPRNPNPRYDSMMDEFGPGSMDERQQSEPVLSAADFFLKQAKGQLLPPNGIARKAKVHQPIGEVDVYYSEGAPPPPASDSSSSSADHSTHPMDVFQHSRSMSVDGTTAPSHHHRRSYHGNPSASFPDDFGFGASASQSNPIAAPVPSQPRSNIPQQAPVSSTAMYEQHGPDGKIKAFVCPLFSCGRLFKRMEHLKRHLRTHTMERPFACNKCNKKFSRSDNLNQHLRTHERTTGGAVPSSPNPDGSAGEGSGGGGAGEYTMDDESEQEDDRAFGNNNGGHGSGGESDDELLARYGGSDGQVYGDGSMNLSNLDLSNFAPPGTYSTEIPMREIEARDVQEVQGDEEGLLAIANAGYAGQPQDNYYTHSSTLFQSNSGGAAADPQWSRLSGSGFNSFGNLSNPNPLQTRGNRSSMGSIPGHYMQTMGHTSNPSITSLHSEDLSTSSLSAPSSKAVFDHHTMYGANVILDDVTSTAGGPIRRHRSMTPSFTRSGEPIRRPPTSNGGDFNSSLPGGAPSSVGSNSGASGHRGYHPYASGYASSSRSNSTHSSPALHNNMPLGGEYTQMRSRNSSFSLGAAPNMVGSDVAMAPPEAASAAFGDAMYRTDSPAFLAQTESPAPYTIDLPNHYLAPGYHFTNQAQGQSSSLPTQFSTEQQSHGGEAYYPQHVPTI